MSSFLLLRSIWRHRVSGPTEMGYRVVHAVTAVGLRVPEDAAVIACEDDEVMTLACRPPLSAIDQRGRVVGYEAGALLTVRLEHAAKLLLETPMPVGDVAAACGFGSSSHFVAQFRARHGCTPAVYRLRNLQTNPAANAALTRP